MNRALIITVGTGIGTDPEEAVRSLAHGIVTSIKASNPDHIVFIATADSQKSTIPEIKNQYPQPSPSEIVLLRDMNDVNGVFETIKARARDLKKEGYDVVIDFTSGTKAMSAGAVLAATSEALRMSYVTGDRSEGKVVKGGERVLTYSPIMGIVEFQEKIVRELFNNYQYDPCLQLIKRIEDLISAPEVAEKVSKFKQLAEGYSLWDKFDHKNALERLRTFDNSLVNIEKNKKFLLRLEKNGFEDATLLLCDLLNNTKRRIEEGKYDDAVARLYRIIERIAQMVLKTKYDIDTADVDLRTPKTSGKLEEETLLKYKRLGDGDAKIRLSLKKDYELLTDLGEEIGKRFSQDESLRDLLQRRNNSILAHGLVPVRRAETERMFEKVKEYVELEIEESSRLREQAAFPKL